MAKKGLLVLAFAAVVAGGESAADFGKLIPTLVQTVSPFLVGEYALRAGYHPDLGVKGIDVYMNLTAGMRIIIRLAFFRPLI